MTQNQTPENYLLELGSSPISFEPVSKFTNVFYDETTKQVFTVRSGGAMGIVVKGPALKTPLNFRVEDKGTVLSVKFSPNHQVLAIQRTSTTIEFLNFSAGEPEGQEYSQPCRGKSAVILGFVWLSNTDFAVISNQGLEHHQVVAEKRVVRLMKFYSLQSNWFVYSASIGLLLISSGLLGNSLNPFLFKNNQFLRLSKFEVEVFVPPNAPQPPRLCLLERDVTCTSLYGNLVVAVLRHQGRPETATSSRASPNAEIVLFTLSKDTPPRKTHILQLNLSGRFAVSIVDNLIVVHHQASRSSVVFDINLPGEQDGRLSLHNPVIGPTPIRPYVFDVPSSAALLSTESSRVSCEMYSSSWVFFQPNIIIDAGLGLLWTVELKLQNVRDFIENSETLIDFLMQRKDSKQVIVNVLRSIISLEPPCDVRALGRIFDRLNEAYRTVLEIEMQSQMAMPAGGPLQPRPAQVLVRPVVYLDQNEVYSQVLSQLTASDKRSNKLIITVLTEYMRSLVQWHIPVQYFIHERLIEALVRDGSFYQLHQLLQYHAISDSKPLACLLLSLESVYAPAYQLALDMLKRLGNANEEIIEILLSKHQVIASLKFARDCGIVDQLPARKFLEAALNSHDSSVFYATYKFFEQRNLRLRGNSVFLKGEHCDVYVRHLRSFHGLSSTLTSSGSS